MGKTKKVVLSIIGVIIVVLVVLGTQNRNRVGVSPAPTNSSGISTVVTEEISILAVPADWLTYTYSDTKYDWQIRYPNSLQIMDRKHGYIAFVRSGDKVPQVLIHAEDSFKNTSVDEALQEWSVPVDPLLKGIKPKIVLLDGMKGVKYQFPYPCEPECARTDVTLFKSEVSGTISLFDISLSSGDKEQGEINNLMLSTFTAGKK